MLSSRITSNRVPMSTPLPRLSRACRMSVQAAAGPKHVVITGGNTGIGLASAKALTRMGFDVTLACRDEAKMAAAAEELRRLAPGARVETVRLDLAELASVRDCASQLLDRGRRIDVLLNNAGVMASPKLSTKDGHEWQLGVNHLGHFAFTGLLLPSLRGHSTGTRIINLSSEAHKFGMFDFSDIKLDKDYAPWAAYGRSKLANLYFTYELSRRLSPSDNVTVNAVHPGVVRTELGRYMLEGSWLTVAAMGVAQFFFKTPEQGAETSVHLASSSAAEGVTSKYYFDSKPQSSNTLSYDANPAMKLWDVSCELTGDFKV